MGNHEIHIQSGFLVTVSVVTQRTVAEFLTPPGFGQPSVAAVLREARVLREAGHYAARATVDRIVARRTPYASRLAPRAGEPVLLVPGFMAGDATLRPMARSLRRHGFRTYDSQIRANVGCTQAAMARLEERLEDIAQQRGSRVRVVGHSLGGVFGRALAARRPDLVSGVVTMGSPVLAPGAHHASLARVVEMLVRLHRAGLAGLMAEDCVAGECAREGFGQARGVIPEDVVLTSIYSRRDGIVDWRACIDPDAEAVEVVASHVGMVVDPHVIAEVVAALRSTPRVAEVAAVG